MPDNTVTLVLDGDVPLSEFSRAIGHFNELVKALSIESGAPSLDWIIQDLQVSSALASAGAIGDEKSVEAVITSYENVAQALETDSDIPYSEPVRTAAKKIVSIEDYRRVPSVRFETARRETIVRVKPPRRVEEIEITAKLQGIAPPQLAVKAALPAYGGVQGRIQTLTTRGGLRFTLYDLFYDKAVSCYLAEEKQDILRDLWGSLATVEGFVTRDPVTGRPLSIRQVAVISPIKEPISRFDYQQARGAAPSLTGLSPEEAIRRIRDAQ